MKPSIGRIVHFQEQDDRILPAIVVAVGADDSCDLTVFDYGSVYGKGAVPFAVASHDPAPVGTWFWPSRVE